MSDPDVVKTLVRLSQVSEIPLKLPYFLSISLEMTSKICFSSYFEWPDFISFCGVKPHTQIHLFEGFSGWRCRYSFQISSVLQPFFGAENQAQTSVLSLSE